MPDLEENGSPEDFNEEDELEALRAFSAGQTSEKTDSEQEVEKTDVSENKMSKTDVPELLSETVEPAVQNGNEELTVRMDPDEPRLSYSDMLSKSDTDTVAPPRKKPDTTNWDKIKPKDIVFSRGGKEHGGKAYLNETRSKLFHPEKEERQKTIRGIIQPVDGRNLDQIAMELCDPFNPRGMIDTNGFLNLSNDENDKRIRVIFQNTGEKESKFNLIAKTASNLVFYGDMRGEELDLTPAYVDIKAFYDLVEDIGSRDAIRATIDDSDALTPNKNRIRRELKKKKEEGVHDAFIRKEMEDFIYEKTKIKPTDLNSVVLKANIEGKVNADERLLRARERAISRTGIGIKRLYTAKTVGDRDVAVMVPMGTVEIETARNLLGFEGILRKIALPILEDLDSLHRVWGFEHRDIKPGNIFYDKDLGKAVLGDFSVIKVSKEERSDLTSGKAIGTPMYMSPKQARGEDTDVRDDIYSFGRTIESFITKESPYPPGYTLQKVVLAIANEEKPFALTHPKNRKVMNEGLGLNAWYSYLNPVKLYKLYKRKKLVKGLEKILSWTCSKNGPTSCKEVYDDIKAILEGEKPLNVNAYLKQSRKSYRGLIEEAYETGKKSVSEETRQAVKKEKKRGTIIAVAALVMGLGGGHVIKGCQCSKGEPEPVQQQYPVDK